MFPKESRLPRAIFQGKPQKRSRFKYGSVSFYPVGTLQTAVIVSKKVARRAVDRNFIRRRSLGALRSLRGLVSGGIVYYPTGEVLRAPYADFKQALVDVCSAR